MKSLSVCVLFLLVTSSIYGQQSEFSNGYIITNSGDSLVGSVKDRKFGFQDELINKLTIRQQNGKVKRIKKKHVFAYEWGGERFERRTVSTQIPIVKIDISSEDFLVQVVEGSVELYKQYFNDFDNHIIEYVYLIKDNATSQYRRLPAIGYKPIIRKYFLGKHDIVEKLDTGKFRYADIPELVREGNQETY